MLSVRLRLRLLGEPSAPSPLHLAQEHVSQFLEPGRRVIEHRKDVLPVLGVERSSRSFVGCGYEERLGCAWCFVALQPLREFDDEVVAQRHPGKPHVLRSSSRCPRLNRGTLCEPLSLPACVLLQQRGAELEQVPWGRP